MKELTAARAAKQHLGAAGASDDEIRVGVSACLLGEEVRYDGGHKHDAYIAETLGRYFRFVRVCPEVEVGLGVPRETLRLVRETRGIRLIAPASSVDHTASMRAYARRRVRQLQELGLSGYLLKKGSPSCGMLRVRTYTTAGMPAPSARGLFADTLMAEMPSLPVEEEGRLNDPALRENFIVRVFAFHRLNRLFQSAWTVGELVGFHASEKLLVMAHAPHMQRVLGRIVAGAKRGERRRVRSAYLEGFMTALARPASRARHVNVLHHMLGYFRHTLAAPVRAELLESIEDYRRDSVPLVVPLTLLRHYVRLHPVPYLALQTYLDPHPKELALRNRV